MFWHDFCNQRCPICLPSQARAGIGATAKITPKHSPIGFYHLAYSMFWHVFCNQRCPIFLPSQARAGIGATAKITPKHSPIGYYPLALFIIYPVCRGL